MDSTSRGFDKNGDLVFVTVRARRMTISPPIVTALVRDEGSCTYVRSTG